MSAITAILTRTNPLGTTLLLVGDDLLSSGSLVSSAEIDKSVFERLLTFAENYQEVRVVISYSNDSKVKIYDYINTVVEDADGNKGLLLDKTGVMLYSGSKPAESGEANTFANADTYKSIDYGSCIDVTGMFDLNDSMYHIYTRVHAPVNCCFIAGYGRVSTNLHLLIGMGLSPDNIRKGRKMTLSYLYSRSSKGDTYDYSTDGLLTLANAPHVYDTTTKNQINYMTTSTGITVDEAMTVNVRPFIKIWEDTEVVGYVFGDQLEMTVNSSSVVTAEAIHTEENPMSPYANDITHVVLGLGAKRWGYWNTSLGVIVPNFDSTTFSKNKLAYRAIDPADLYNSTDGYFGVVGAAETADGQWHYSGFFIDPNLQTVIDNVSST